MLDSVHDALWFWQAPVNGVGNNTVRPEKIRVAPADSFLDCVQVLNRLGALGRLQLLGSAENDVALRDSESVDDLISHTVPSVDTRADIEGFWGLCLSSPGSGSSGQQPHGRGTASVVHSTPPILR